MSDTTIYMMMGDADAADVDTDEEDDVDDTDDDVVAVVVDDDDDVNDGGKHTDRFLWFP